MPLPLLIELESVAELAGAAELARDTGLTKLAPTVPVPLDSTAIESASYNMYEQLLTLHMRDGKTIEYYEPDNHLRRAGFRALARRLLQPLHPARLPVHAAELTLTLPSSLSLSSGP
jgi:hypothetical protein